MKTYLAILASDSKFDDEVRTYLTSQNIEVIDYYKNLGILKLQCHHNLSADELEYIKYLELESDVEASDTQ